MKFEAPPRCNINSWWGDGARLNKKEQRSIALLRELGWSDERNVEALALGFWLVPRGPHFFPVFEGVFDTHRRDGFELVSRLAEEGRDCAVLAMSIYMFCHMRHDYPDKEGS